MMISRRSFAIRRNSKDNRTLPEAGRAKTEHVSPLAYDSPRGGFDDPVSPSSPNSLAGDG